MTRILVVCLLLGIVASLACAGSETVSEEPRGTYVGYTHGIVRTLTFEGDTLIAQNEGEAKRIWTYRLVGLETEYPGIEVTNVIDGMTFTWSYTYNSEHDAIEIMSVYYYKE